MQGVTLLAQLFKKATREFPPSAPHLAPDIQSLYRKVHENIGINPKYLLVSHTKIKPFILTMHWRKVTF